MRTFSTRSSRFGVTESFKTFTDLSGGAVEFVRRPAPPIGVDAEAVTGKAGEHMNVSVEYLLERCGAISQEQIDPLTAKATSAKGPGQQMCDTKDGRAQIRI